MMIPARELHVGDIILDGDLAIEIVSVEKANQPQPIFITGYDGMKLAMEIRFKDRERPALVYPSRQVRLLSTRKDREAGLR